MRVTLARVTGPETGADLISFPAGADGTYPVWLARDIAGAVTCFVVVTSMMPDARLL